MAYTAILIFYLLGCIYRHLSQMIDQLADFAFALAFVCLKKKREKKNKNKADGGLDGHCVSYC